MSETEQDPLLVVRELTVGFPTLRGQILAADSVSFSIARGEVLGLVGESGSGKSMTLRALVGLVPQPGETVAGELAWQGELLDPTRPKQLARLRGREITMIFQDPTSSLNPVHTIGSHLVETLRLHRGLGRREAGAKALELLERVGIAAAAKRSRDYPHQLSGGMRQRVMIALAIAPGPRLLLADEPTTALDVTIQDQILSLLAELQLELGMAVVLVSHDLAVVAERCDRIAVMYAGHVVELGPTRGIIDSARHPYTQGLIAAVPAPDPAKRAERLASIPGQPPSLADLPPGCPFALRCQYARAECAGVSMELDRPESGHGSACPFVDVVHVR